MSIVFVKDRRTVIVKSRTGAAAGANGAKGDPGSPGEGYATRAAMAARLAPALLDDVYLTEAGREGKFVVDDEAYWTSAIAADTAQAIFVPSTADATKVYRRVTSGIINPEWAGMKRGDAGGANRSANSSAFAALAAVLITLGNSGVYNGGTETIRFPAADTYELAGDDELTDAAFQIEGAGPAGDNFGTTFDIPAGHHGLIFAKYNTSGATGTRADAKGSDFSNIRNIRFKGGYSGTEGNYHLCVVRSHGVNFFNCYWQDAEGDAIHSVSTSGGGGAAEGESNCCHVWGGRAIRCTNGLTLDGADTNAWVVTGFDATQCRRWGAIASVFLHAAFYGCHFDSNGLVVGSTPCVVSYSGFRYCVKKDQGTPASTNAPSGNTNDTAYWLYIGAGGTSPGNNINTWSSGTTYRDGGSIRGDGEGNAGILVSGCYLEGGQGLAQLDPPALVIGGAVLPNLRGVAALYGGTSIGTSGGLLAAGNLEIRGNLTDLGPISGSGVDTNVNINYSGTEGAINFYEGGVLKGRMRMISGVLYVNANAMVLREGGVDFLTGSMAPIADLAGAPTQADFNALLAALRGIKILQT